MEREVKILAKLADGAIGTARIVDEIVVNTKSLIRFSNKISEPDAVLVSNVGQHTESNPHFFEDLVKGTLGKLEGLNIGGR